MSKAFEPLELYDKLKKGENVSTFSILEGRLT